MIILPFGSRNSVPLLPSSAGFGGVHHKVVLRIDDEEILAVAVAHAPERIGRLFFCFVFTEHATGAEIVKARNDATGNFDEKARPIGTVLQHVAAQVVERIEPQCGEAEYGNRCQHDQARPDAPLCEFHLASPHWRLVTTKVADAGRQGLTGCT
jgi:hypothetical protein